VKITNTIYRFISVSILLGLLSIISHDLVAHNHSDYSDSYGIEYQLEQNSLDSHCFLCEFHKTNKFTSVDFQKEVNSHNTQQQLILLDYCRLFNGHKCLNSGRSPPIK
jgi:hypothetical protein